LKLPGKWGCQTGMLQKCCVILFCTLIIQPVLAFDHKYEDYGALLESVIVTRGHQTRVDYRRLKSHVDQLEQITAGFGAVSKAEFSGWSRDEQLAFLINAYNALTLELVSRHYPDIDSIRDIGGFFGNPWKLRFFILFGESSHLDHIEHDLIRGQFMEPRIHFSLVCASVSCPPLVTEPYQGDRLDAQLQAVTRRFLTDPERNRYLAADNRLQLSPLFKWYKADFISSAGSVLAFVAPYLTDNDTEKQQLLDADPGIHYLPYDWSLNDIDNM